MFDNAERKAARLAMVVDQEVSSRTYNLILGGVVLYGLIMNALMVLLCADFFLSIDPTLYIIIYFISCMAGCAIAVKSTNPIVSFIGYNLIVLPVGGLLAMCLPAYDPSIIVTAMAGTAVVVFAMLCLAVAKPDFFLGLGRTLFTCLFIGIIVELIATFIFHYGGTLFDWAFVILFSCYIGYDWNVAQSYGKTIDNAVDSAIDVYLDIINIFVRLLSILSKKRD